MKNILSKINKRAWGIRKEAAKKFDCPVMEISWKICFSTAKEEIEMGGGNIEFKDRRKMGKIEYIKYIKKIKDAGLIKEYKKFMRSLQEEQAKKNKKMSLDLLPEGYKYEHVLDDNEGNYRGFVASVIGSDGDDRKFFHVENGEICPNEKIMDNTKKWAKSDKERYYFNNGYAKKANAYWTKDEDDTNARYVWEMAGGFVCASKCYNGAVKEQIEEII